VHTQPVRTFSIGFALVTRTARADSFAEAMTTGKAERYGERVLGTSSNVEERRLRSIAAVADPFTHDVLRPVGLSGGWRCLEVGAGGGSIALWLAEKSPTSRRQEACSRPTSIPATWMRLRLRRSECCAMRGARPASDG
jgi:hypothetical protein